jgi:hypothetical protein
MTSPLIKRGTYKGEVSVDSLAAWLLGEASEPTLPIDPKDLPSYSLSPTQQ